MDWVIFSTLNFSSNGTIFEIHPLTEFHILTRLSNSYRYNSVQKNVSHPYKLTRLSNTTSGLNTLSVVSHPYKLTRPSNQSFGVYKTEEVSHPYKLTRLSNEDLYNELKNQVSHPYKLTRLSNVSDVFEAPLCGFTSLQTYKTLKQNTNDTET